jgi:hypothetical protein
MQRLVWIPLNGWTLASALSSAFPNPCAVGAAPIKIAAIDPGQWVVGVVEK